MRLTGRRGGEATTERLGRWSPPMLVAAGAITLAAVLVRVDLYVGGRSLWLDESLLALNVLERPFSQLDDPLDLSQGAPLGFLAATKLAVVSFGKSEEVLRLLPLLSSLVALCCYVVLAGRVTRPLGALLALAMFASSAPLIYYSVEFKQYSTEVATVVALSAVAIPARDLTTRRYVAVSLLGAVLLWFAYASVFFLSAFACVNALAFARERRWTAVRIVVAATAIWFASGLGVYAFSYEDLGSVQEAVERASGGGSLFGRFEGIVDGGRHLANATVGTAGTTSPEDLVRLVAVILALVGAATLLRSRPAVCLMLALPIAFMFAAVAAGRYPAFERTFVVGAPGSVLFVAHGTVSLAGRLRRPLLSPAVGSALAAVLLAHPVKTAAEGVGATTPRNEQGVRPLVATLVDQWEPRDALYVHYAAQYSFRYYAECECLDATAGSPAPPLSFATRRTTGPRLWHPALLSVPPRLYVGSRHRPGDWDAYLREVDRLAGRSRVWVLSSHWESPEEEDFITRLLPEHLDELGKQLQRASAGSGRLLLYDLSKPR